ncbi:CBS domain-containing protein [Mesobacillus maritimus]|uniref:CBS domain-containing protein n=1 Tax=Mesobacillus maritimus TaxID=1643336 RepID=UPI00203F9A21|nr:CBS domain-containing protein [Mesobacillus maritimus]MCM3587389.1 CBS domain-containing protein [Mesobacillus maritimus]MCM3667949.1 CBS domain-containing protein [Mesobacillus maritimus]
MKVKDFMITDVIKGHPNDSVTEIMKRMVENKIGGLPICSEDGKLIGMVSDGDILRAIKPIDPRFYHYLIFTAFGEGEDLGERLNKLAETEIINIAKTRGVISVTEEDDMEKAVSIFAQNHFKKLPVVNRNMHVVGVISRGDVIRKIQTSILEKVDIAN